MSEKASHQTENDIAFVELSAEIVLQALPDYTTRRLISTLEDGIRRKLENANMELIFTLFYILHKKKALEP